MGVLPGQDHPHYHTANRGRVRKVDAASVADPAVKAAMQKQVDTWLQTAARYEDEANPRKVASS